MKANIGYVCVIKGDPPNGNPYLAIEREGRILSERLAEIVKNHKGESKNLLWNERVFMLLQFFLGKDTTGHTLWYMPSNGGAHVITRDDVDWETSGIPKIKGNWHRDGEVLKCMTCGRECYVDQGVYVDDGLRCSCDGH
jgi:hypothetical protein